jgi:hypothetical protein
LCFYQKKTKRPQTVIQGEEERGMREEESQDNSQTEAVADEISRQTEHSQTPLLGSVEGSDADDDTEEEREEQTTGSLWGHACLPPSVYGNNPKTVSSPDNVALTIFLS